MSYISAAALERAASPITGAPATPIDAFTLPEDIPDAPGDASAAEARALAPGTPSDDWRARGLAHPAGRGWEVVTPASPEKPAYTSLAAELLAEPEEERAVFTRALQVQFLHALAACGAVRRASASVGVSYRTVYRERRASRAFARAWDAALIAARAVHADVLATRAIDGVEEIVFYRGEEVGRRVRYDSRLLLAHLARLDKLCEDAAPAAIAEDFEGAMERFGAGENLAAPEAPVSSPGQCDRCDTAGAAEDEPPAQPPCPDCGGACLDFDAPLTDADCQWLGNRLARMDAARPRGAAKPFQLCPDGDPEGEVEEAQLLAFEDGVDRWWQVLPSEMQESDGPCRAAA